MQVNYVREHERFIEYAADERLPANVQLLWYALMHIFNQRAEGNEWPDGFIRITNDRLFTYLPIKWDAMAKARNALKQMGRIDFRSGSRNKIAPEYRIIPFYPLCCPFKTDNAGGNMGGNTGGNRGGNPGDNQGDINININNTESEQDTETHRDGNNSRPAGARARTYTDAHGREQPCRFDGAYLTSDRARAAVAQRILDQFAGDMDANNAHGRICHWLAEGMEPEIFEDEVDRYTSLSEFLGDMAAIFHSRHYEENRDRMEMRKWMRVARGNPDLARWHYEHSERFRGVSEG